MAKLRKIFPAALLLLIASAFSLGSFNPSNAQSRNLKALEYSRAYQQSYLLSLSPGFLDFAALRSE